MAASDHVSPTQLKMFMTPDELVGGQGYVHGSVDQGDDSIDDLMQNKLEDAKSSNLYNKIMDRGVEKPVIVAPHESTPMWNSGGKPGTFILGNGNHRVAVSAEKQRATGRPQFVPVIHDEDYMGYGARKHFGIADS